MLCWLRNGEFSSYKPRQLDSFRHLTSGEYQQAAVARDVMSSPVLTVEAGASLEQAWDVMQNYGIAHLAVMEEGQFCGLLSDRDLLESDDLRAAVKSVMATELLLASPDESIHLVAQIMVKYHIHCVPLLDIDYDLVGVLTTTDILGCLTYQAPSECWA